MSIAPSNILVIDDEEDLRALMEYGLTALGHRVSTASTGEEAIELARTRPIDLAICDMRMPGMDGSATVMALKELAPDAEVLIVTGYARDETLRSLEEQGSHCLRKPFDLDELERVVQQLLERRRGG